MNRFFSSTNVSASALAAERFRMEVIANNIANALTTRTAQGGPYRRQQVTFASLLESRRSGAFTPGENLHGVRVVSVEEDPSSFPLVYQPGHPDAQADGFVAYPNVQIAMEMVDLISAQRAYESNLSALKSFREVTENTLSLLRSL